MLQDRYVDVGPHRTRYWQAGDEGSVVVLLHGIACSVLEWESNIEAIASRHRVFAVDLLGFGLTDKPADETYALRNLAQFVLDFLSTQDVGRAHFAGNSLGGRLTLESALLAPERVTSLLLVDPAGMERRGTLAEFRLATVPLVGELLTRPNPLATRMLWRKAFADPAPFVTDALVQTKVALASLPGAQSAFLKTLRGFVDVQGFRPKSVASLQAALPSIAAPTLVVWGDRDRLVPARHAEVLRRRLPDVEVQIWNRCGHVPQIECAARFNETALAFWDRVDRDRATA